MPTIKQQVLQMIERLPDGCTIPDIRYHLYVMESVTRGLDDIEHGRVYTHEEAKELLQSHFDRARREFRDDNSAQQRTGQD